MKPDLTPRFAFIPARIGAATRERLGESPHRHIVVWHGNKTRWLAKLRLMSCVLLLSAASYVIARQWVIESVKILGVSMAPNLLDSHTYLVNRLVYLYREPRVGEVVLIRDPIDGLPSVKRIVAGPGDSIGFVNGDVIVNGVKLKEPYLPTGIKTWASRESSPDTGIVVRFVRCKCGEYFVLGDNRAASVDSRDFGPIRRDDIIGLVIH